MSRAGCSPTAAASSEGEARTPRPALQPGVGGPRRGADVRRRQPAHVPDAEREVDSDVDVPEDAPVPRGRRRAARVPVVFSGLGRRGKRIIRAKSSRPRSPTESRTRSRLPTPGRTCSRAAAPADGRLGEVPRPATRQGRAPSPVVVPETTPKSSASRPVVEASDAPDPDYARPSRQPKPTPDLSRQLTRPITVPDPTHPSPIGLCSPQLPLRRWNPTQPCLSSAC